MRRKLAAFASRTMASRFPCCESRRERANAHPLFRYLTEEAPGVLGTEGIKWNFTKFLVDKEGNVITRFGSVDEARCAFQRHRKLL